MKTYIVFRIGSNGMNQPMQQEMALGTVEADNRTKAGALAFEKYAKDCYSNQRIEVRNTRFVSTEVLEELQERLALEAA